MYGFPQMEDTYQIDFKAQNLLITCQLNVEHRSKLYFQWCVCVALIIMPRQGEVARLT